MGTHLISLNLMLTQKIDFYAKLLLSKNKLQCEKKNPLNMEDPGKPMQLHREVKGQQYILPLNISTQFLQ